MKLMEREEFDNAINSIPAWIKDGSDLKKYTPHLQYRLIQYRECLHAVMEHVEQILKNDELYEKIYETYLNAHTHYDDLYLWPNGKPSVDEIEAIRKPSQKAIDYQSMVCDAHLQANLQR